MTHPEPTTLTTASAAETFAVGEALGQNLPGGLVIGLVGPLGAGKTHLVKGIAAGNAVGDAPRVTSPTFTLVHEYAGACHLYHVDVYRLSGPRELEALGFDEMQQPDSAVVVEWADRVRDIMPDDTLWIELEPRDQTTRALTFRPTGQAAARCVTALRDARS